MAHSSATDAMRVTDGFHALSDVTRVEILDLLRGGERCVCELTDALDVAQSRLSFHLRVLKEAGLVADRRDGRWVYYTLNTTALDDLEAFIGHLRTVERTSSRRVACCD